MSWDKRTTQTCSLYFNWPSFSLVFVIFPFIIFVLWKHPSDTQKSLHYLCFFLNAIISRSEVNNIISLRKLFWIESKPNQKPLLLKLFFQMRRAVSLRLLLIKSLNDLSRTRLKFSHSNHNSLKTPASSWFPRRAACPDDHISHLRASIQPSAGASVMTRDNCCWNLCECLAVLVIMGPSVLWILKYDSNPPMLFSLVQLDCEMIPGCQSVCLLVLTPESNQNGEFNVEQSWQATMWLYRQNLLVLKLRLSRVSLCPCVERQALSQ